MNAWTENSNIAREQVRTYLLGSELKRIAELEQETKLKGHRLAAFAMGDDNALTRYDIVLIHLRYVTQNGIKREQETTT